MIRQLPRFSPGDDPRKALNAGFLNELIVSSRRANEIDSSGRAGGVGGTPPTTLVKVHNDSEDTLPFGAVIIADGPAGDNEFDTDETARWLFRRSPYFTAADPASAKDQPLIVDRPIDAGEIGYAAIAGLAVTRIDVGDAGHLYAVPVVGETGHLASAEAGPVRILHKAPADDGDIGWAVVLLGGGAGEGGGTCIDVDTSDTFTITVPGKVISWEGSIDKETCEITLTPTYDDDTTITFEARLQGNTCDELTLTVNEV